MIKLSTFFSNEEKDTLLKCAGSAYEVLSSIEGESFVLNDEGQFSYNECFSRTDIDFFAQQKYDKVIPYRVIRFYNYYLMNTEDEKNIWYRGRKDKGGNWEYECFSDSLQEAFECL